MMLPQKNIKRDIASIIKSVENKDNLFDGIRLYNTKNDSYNTVKEILTIIVEQCKLFYKGKTAEIYSSVARNFERVYDYIKKHPDII